MLTVSVIWLKTYPTSDHTVKILTPSCIAALKSEYQNNQQKRPLLTSCVKKTVWRLIQAEFTPTLTCSAFPIYYNSHHVNFSIVTSRFWVFPGHSNTCCLFNLLLFLLRDQHQYCLERGREFTQTTLQNFLCSVCGETIKLVLVDWMVLICFYSCVDLYSWLNCLFNFWDTCFTFSYLNKRMFPWAMVLIDTMDHSRISSEGSCLPLLVSWELGKIPISQRSTSKLRASFT